MKNRSNAGKRIGVICLTAAVLAAMAGCAVQPSATSAATPMAAETASPAPVRTTPGPTETPSPTPEAIPSPTPEATPTPEPTAPPSPTPAYGGAGPYGVFIGLDPEDASRLAGYGTVVIDAAYFSAEEIGALHAAGQTVYSYLNIGSVEKFRDYYDAFRRSTLGAYENWPDERWVDVANTEWQDFTVHNLAAGLAAKGVDGFFLDNADVYYLYHREEIYQGLAAILTGLGEYGKPVIINGGDTFVRALIANGQAGLITGVNQEEVFTLIDFDNGTYGTQDAEDQAYYKGYLDLCKQHGLAVYLIEYAPEPGAVEQAIADYCAENGFMYYISAGLELD
jgi:hypothetical protein